MQPVEWLVATQSVALQSRNRTKSRSVRVAASEYPLCTWKPSWTHDCPGASVRLQQQEASTLEKHNMYSLSHWSRSLPANVVGSFEARVAWLKAHRPRTAQYTPSAQVFLALKELWLNPTKLDAEPCPFDHPHPTLPAIPLEDEATSSVVSRVAMTD
ncbi:hypothetical protein M422DRAFT_238496 [Sphaerobolus stellatus SS14]|nr:hypothetical protein M422DRAFT_238496 [Sphaerobolus stellatus SS14]